MRRGIHRITHIAALGFCAGFLDLSVTKPPSPSAAFFFVATFSHYPPQGHGLCTMI
jgi:hypothetical protein